MCLVGMGLRHDLLVLLMTRYDVRHDLKQPEGMMGRGDKFSRGEMIPTFLQRTVHGLYLKPDSKKQGHKWVVDEREGRKS